VLLHLIGEAVGVSVFSFGTLFGLRSMKLIEFVTVDLANSGVDECFPGSRLNGFPTLAGITGPSEYTAHGKTLVRRDTQTDQSSLQPYPDLQLQRLHHANLLPHHRPRLSRGRSLHPPRKTDEHSRERIFLDPPDELCDRRHCWGCDQFGRSGGWWGFGECCG